MASRGLEIFQTTFIPTLCPAERTVLRVVAEDWSYYDCQADFESAQRINVVSAGFGPEMHAKP